MNSLLHDMYWVVSIRTPVLTAVARFFSALGYAEYMIGCLAIGYWIWRKRAFAGAIAVASVSGVVNAYLKDLLQDPRPPDELHMEPGNLGPGFPSGHAQLSVAIWMFLALEIRRPWAWVVCVLLMLGQAGSRLYLGVHDIEDVAGGMLLGLAVLLTYRKLQSGNWGRSKQIPGPWKVVALAGVLAGWMLLAEPVGRYYMLRDGMLGIAFWIGMSVEGSIVGSEQPPSFRARSLAALLGLGGYVIIHSAARPGMLALHLPASTIAVTQSTLIGIWVSLGAPLLSATFAIVPSRLRGRKSVADGGE